MQRFTERNVREEEKIRRPHESILKDIWFIWLIWRFICNLGISVSSSLNYIIYEEKEEIKEQIKLYMSNYGKYAAKSVKKTENPSVFFCAII